MPRPTAFRGHRLAHAPQPPDVGRARAAISFRPSLRWAAPLLLLALTGAVPGGRNALPPPSEPAATAPRHGGTLVFVQEPVTSLDPRTAADVYESTLVYQIHRGLLQFSPNLTPVPGVARTWTITRDGLAYTFELRPNVRFHNGRILTADDVRFSLERIYEPGTELGIAGQALASIDGALDYHAGRAHGIRGIEVLGPRTIRIRLSRPSGAFLWALAVGQAAIVPRDVIEKVGNEEFSRNPVGCGPFRLASRSTDETRLVAFEDYYRGRALLDSLVFVTPPANATNLGVDMLLEGKVSMAEIPGFRRHEISRRTEFRLITGRELSLAFIGINGRIPPLDNVHVRRALAHATDRARILQANPEGHSIPTGILPPGMSCYSPEAKLLPYDLEKARAELALAGFPEGRGLPEIAYVSSRNSSRTRVVDSLLVAGWRSVGLPVRLERVGWAELSHGVEQRRLSLFSLSWVADLPDPDSFMASLFSSRSTYNYFSFAHPEVDSLLQRGRELVDPRMRQAIYRAIESRVVDDVAMVPLSNNILTYGVRKPVRGIELTPLGISYVDFSHAWLEGDAGERAELD